MEGFDKKTNAQSSQQLRSTLTNIKKNNKQARSTDK